MSPFNTGSIIDQHLTLTCSPATSGADFCGDDALVQALAWLDGCRITGSVTIALQDGVYGAGAPLPEIDLSHPDGERILIQGRSDEAAVFTMSAPPDPGVGTFTLNNQDGEYQASDFAPGGDYHPFIIYITGSDGNDGPYTVTSAARTETSDGTGAIAITVRETIYSAAPGGSVYLLPSNRCQLVFRPNVNGVARRSTGGGCLSGLRLVGNGSGNQGGVVSFSGAELQIQSMIVAGFKMQYWAAYGGRIVHPDPYGRLDRADVALGGAAGFYSYHHGDIHAPRCVAGWSDAGFSADTYGAIYARGSIAAGNKDVGFSAAIHGQVFAHQAVAHNNATGCRAVNQGTVFREGLRVAGNTADYDPGGRPPRHGITGGWMI